MAISSIIGGVLGAALGLYQGYQQKRANDRQLRLAQQQFELAKRQAAEEEQARNKADQKEVDVEGLLSESTATGLPATQLTGAKGLKPVVANPLAKKKNLLGG